MAHTLYIVGIGPGNPDYVVPRGLNLIKHATVLVGSERSLELKYIYVCILYCSRYFENCYSE